MDINEIAKKVRGREIKLFTNKSFKSRRKSSWTLCRFKYLFGKDDGKCS